MTERRDVVRKIDAMMRENDDTPYGDRIRAVGVDQEADLELLLDAVASLAHRNVNLSRWRSHPEVTDAIRAAREALDEAAQAMARYVYRLDLATEGRDE